jgi:hypothetical protein
MIILIDLLLGFRSLLLTKLYITGYKKKCEYPPLTCSSKLVLAHFSDDAFRRLDRNHEIILFFKFCIYNRSLEINNRTTLADTCD